MTYEPRGTTGRRWTQAVCIARRRVVFSDVQKVSCDILPSGDDKPIDETDVDGTGKVGSGSGGSLPSPSFTHASIVVFVAISTILFRFVRCASWH